MTKVAIVGSSDTTRHHAPYGDTSWEIWTLNDMAILNPPRVDRWFQLHSPQSLLDAAARGEAAAKVEVQVIRDEKVVPVYMHEPADWGATTVEFPTQALIKEFGPYFTSSIAWMMALAIYEGADEIGLWGVDMAHHTEYGTQRPSCEYFIGVARGRGIPVFIPPESSLLACRVQYGLAEDKFSAELARRLENLTVEKNQQRELGRAAMINEARLDGAIQNLQQILLWYGE